MTVFLCDVNVWVALTVEHHLHARACESWFEALSDSDRTLFCRCTQQSFLRLLTVSSVFAPYGNPPLGNEAAWRAYEVLRADRRVDYTAVEPVGLDERWKAFTNRPVPSPKLWMDAYLAAFAAAGNLRLVTTDTAFSQFVGLDPVVLRA